MCFIESYGQSLQVSERNTSKVFVELLRGRDGLSGRDGFPGPAGPQGKDGQRGNDGPPGPYSGTIAYTRWGSRTCPNDSDIVYSGTMGGNPWNRKGGGANFLCMPMDPEYSLAYSPGIRGHSFIGGVGYGRTLWFSGGLCCMQCTKQVCIHNDSC